MKLRTVDSPGVIKPKSKFYFVIRAAIICLLVLCAAAIIMLKDRISPPYKKVLDDLCIAIQRTDGRYMQEHMPDIQGDDKTETDETKSDKIEEKQNQLDDYVLEMVSQITGRDEVEDEDLDFSDEYLFSSDFSKIEDKAEEKTEENRIENASYKIIEKHKMKSWDVIQEEESGKTANKLQEYIEFGFLEEETESKFSDYAYEYRDGFWGTQKKYKVFDKENVYMLLVEFSFTWEESWNTYQTIVYVAKAEKRWVLLAIENIEHYEGVVFQEDSL